MQIDDEWQGFHHLTAYRWYFCKREREQERKLFVRFFALKTVRILMILMINVLSAQRLDLFAWCVRLSRLWVGFWTHFESLYFSFHFFHINKFTWEKIGFRWKADYPHTGITDMLFHYTVCLLVGNLKSAHACPRCPALSWTLNKQ